MKKIISILMTLAFVISAASLAVTADEPIQIFIDGTELVIPEGDTQPFIEDGRTLVPMRVIFEALGAYVDWNGEERRIDAFGGGNFITLMIDSPVIEVNGNNIELDVPAQIVGDRTVVPVRAVAEGMDCTVEWIGETRTIIINTKDEKTNNGGDKTDTETHAEITKPDEKPDNTNAETENPWMEFYTLEELNTAIAADSPLPFVMYAPPADFTVKEKGYRYNYVTDMAEILAACDGAEIALRAQMPLPDAEDDISGVSGVEFQDIVPAAPGVDVTIFKSVDGAHAIWVTESELSPLNHSFAVTASSFGEANSIIVSYVMEIARQF